MFLALTLRSLTSTLLPQSTIGMLPHTLCKSLYQTGTFLYVVAAVTSNISMAQSPVQRDPKMFSFEFSIFFYKNADTLGQGVVCYPCILEKCLYTKLNRFPILYQFF